MSFFQPFGYSFFQAYESLPFFPGEQLEYSLSVWRIPAGQARMGVSQTQSIPGQPQFRLLTVMNTNELFSLFFPVHNEVSSDINSQALLPTHMIFHRREGKRHEDFDITFDRKSKIAIVI
jgi:hypothetical protein